MLIKESRKSKIGTRVRFPHELIYSCAWGQGSPVSMSIGLHGNRVRGEVFLEKYVGQMPVVRVRGKMGEP